MSLGHSKVDEAIQKLKESKDIEPPAGQGAMPHYYSQIITLLREAIKLLEEQIKSYSKSSRPFN